MRERTYLLALAGLLTVFVVVLTLATLGPPSEHHSTGGATALPRGLSTSLALPTHVIPAGSSITARVVVENKTGHPLSYSPCDFYFRGALSTTDHQQANSNYYTLCATQRPPVFTFPTGTSRYPIALAARYQHCSSASLPGRPACLANGVKPPLPRGRYYATVTLEPVDMPTPRPVAVRVT